MREALAQCPERGRIDVLAIVDSIIRSVSFASGDEMPTTSNLRLVAPVHQNLIVPSRATNAAYRKREHLTPAEIDKLIEAAKGNRLQGRHADPSRLPAWAAGLQAFELEWSQDRLGMAPRCMCAGSRTASQPRTQRACPVASVTTKHSANSSTDHGGGRFQTFCALVRRRPGRQERRGGELLIERRNCKSACPPCRHREAGAGHRVIDGVERAFGRIAFLLGGGARL